MVHLAHFLKRYHTDILLFLRQFTPLRLSEEIEIIKCYFLLILTVFSILQLTANIAFHSVPLHRNLRYIFVCAIFHAWIGAISRGFLLSGQMFMNESIDHLASQLNDKERVLIVFSFFVVLIITGGVMFIIVFLYNLRKVAKLSGRRANRYSLARSFQLRENIILRSVVPIFVITSPSLLFLTAYLFLPLQFNFYPLFSIAIFDLWTSGPMADNRYPQDFPQYCLFWSTVYPLDWQNPLCTQLAQLSSGLCHNQQRHRHIHRPDRIHIWDGIVIPYPRWNNSGVALDDSGLGVSSLRGWKIRRIGKIEVLCRSSSTEKSSTFPLSSVQLGTRSAVPAVAVALPTIDRKMR
uniref:G protein-coupled receptor n=1 Tax=Pristionchus pacificus TaxID=54126 RepID=A0A8R1YVM3_PRIPA